MIGKKTKLVAKTPKSFDTITNTHMPSLLPNLKDAIGNKHAGVTIVPKIVAEWAFEEDLKCAICWAKIKPGDRTSTCPHCGRKFHYDHLRTWLRSKSFCPSCRGDWFTVRTR